MQAKKNQVVEHKVSAITFPNPQEGVKFNWCQQNSTSLHEHDFYEFVIITEGKVRHFHNENTNLVSKGMCFLIKPGEFHQFSPYHNSHSQHINLAITPQELQKLCSSIWHNDFFEQINTWTIPPTLTLPKNDFDSISNSINRLNPYSLHFKNTYAVIKMIILEILTFFSNKWEKSELNEGSRPAWLNDFLETLNDPNVFTMKLKDIYPLAPYSQSMLNIYFHKYLDSTLVNYITKLKISYACTLLRYTDSSPLEISNKLAYDSLSHFNRVFKTITGTSPIAYRKEFSAPSNS